MNRRQFVAAAATPALSVSPQTTASLAKNHPGLDYKPGKAVMLQHRRELT